MSAVCKIVDGKDYSSISRITSRYKNVICFIPWKNGNKVISWEECQYRYYLQFKLFN